MTKNVVYYIDGQGGNPVWDFATSLAVGEREKCFEYIAYLEEMGEKVRRPVGDYPSIAKKRMNDFILRHQKGQIQLGGKNR